MGFWKLRRDHRDRRGIRYDVYRCPLCHRCLCYVSCSVVTGPDFLELQRHGLHDKDSHNNDDSKKLKYYQVVSVVEAAKSAPTLSGSVLRRNLMDHDSPTKIIPPQSQRCVHHIVQNVCKQVTQQHLDDFNLKDSIGSLHVLCDTNLFSDLMLKHNYREDAYSFFLFEFVVQLGSQVSQNATLCALPLALCG
jgi:hypothetical protein